MMITFQRQIESVGLHRALISRASDRVERRCSCIRFHRRQRTRGREGARLQTDRHCERRPRQVHSAFKNNEIRGGNGDPDRHVGIIHFHPLAQTAPRSDCQPSSADGLNCLLITTTQSHRLRTKSWSESWRQNLIGGAVGVKQSVSVRLRFCGWQWNWPQDAQPTEKRGKICMPLHGPTK